MAEEPKLNFEEWKAQKDAKLTEDFNAWKTQRDRERTLKSVEERNKGKFDVLGITQYEDPTLDIIKNSEIGVNAFIQTDFSKILESTPPERNEEVQNAIAIEKLRIYFEGKDNRKYTNDDDLIQRYTDDSGYRDPRMAVNHYTEIFTPKEVDFSNYSQATRQDSAWKHLAFGVYNDFFNNRSRGLARFVYEGYKGIAETPNEDENISKLYNQSLLDVLRRAAEVRDPDLPDWFQGEVERLGGPLNWTSDPAGDSFAGKVARGIGGSAPSVLMMMASGPLGFGGNFVQMYDEGYQKTGDNNMAMKYGILGGVLETIGDKLLVTDLTPKLKTKILFKVLEKMGVNFITEGTTEVAQDILLEYMSTGKFNAEGLWDTFTVAGTSGMIMGGSIEGIQTASRTINQRQSKIEIIQDLDTTIEHSNMIIEEKQKDLQDEDLTEDAQEAIDHANEVIETAQALKTEVENSETFEQVVKSVTESDAGTKFKTAVKNIGELQSFLLNPIGGIAGRVLTDGDWKSISENYSEEDMAKGISHLDPELQKLIIDSMRGDKTAQKKYNTYLDTARIYNKLENNVPLTPEEEKTLKEQFKNEFKDKVPEDRDNQEVYREIIRSTTSLPGLAKFARALANTSHLKFYPNILNRMRKYERDTHIQFHEWYMKLQLLLDGLKIIEHIHDVGFGNITVDDTGFSKEFYKILGLSLKGSDNIGTIFTNLKNNLFVALLNGKNKYVRRIITQLGVISAGIQNSTGYTSRILATVNVMNKKGSQYTSIEQAKAIEEVRKELPDDPKLLEAFDKGETIKIAPSNVKLSRNQERQIKRLFETVGMISKGFGDGSLIDSILEESSVILGKDQVKEYFPRAIKKKALDSLRKYILANDIETFEDRQTKIVDFKNGLAGINTGKKRTIVKVRPDLLQFYENPAVSLENYLMAVSRAKARNDLLNVVTQEKRKKVVELKNKVDENKNKISEEKKNLKDLRNKVEDTYQEGIDRVKKAKEKNDTSKIKEQISNYKDQLKTAKDKNKETIQDKLDRANERLDKKLKSIEYAKEQAVKKNDNLKKKIESKTKYIKTLQDRIAKNEESIKNLSRGVAPRLLEVNDDGTLKEPDLNSLETDIIASVENDISIDQLEEHEKDEIVKTIRNILEPPRANKFYSNYRRLVGIKYVTGPLTIAKQYMDIGITLGELLRYQGFADGNIKDYLKGVETILGPWAKENNFDLKDFLEQIGAEMTEPDVDKANIPLGASPVSILKEIKRIRSDYVMNKSYNKNRQELIDKLDEFSKGQSEVAKEVKRYLLEGGELSKQGKAFLEQIEGMMLSGLRMTDKYNKMLASAWRIKQIEMMSSENRIKMLTQLMGDPKLAKQASEDIDNKKLTDATRAVFYTILADKQPVSTGESSGLRSTVLKPLLILKGFAFKESARHFDMLIAPFSKGVASLKTSAGLNMEANRIKYDMDSLAKQIEKENNPSRKQKLEKELAYKKSDYHKTMKQSTYASGMAREFFSQYGKGLKEYALFSVLPNTLLNMGLEAILVKLGWQDEPDNEMNFFTKFFTEFFGRLFPLLSGYDVMKAIQYKDPAMILEGMTRLPLGLGSQTLFQIGVGLFDNDEPIDWEKAGEDLGFYNRLIDYQD